MKTDKLTPELRKIEKEIDLYYKSNPLLNLPFATAAWSLLAVAEHEIFMKELTGTNGIQGIHALASHFAVELEHPLSWLYGSCKQGGQVSFVFDEDLHKASKDLFELGKNYACFVFAYTCASRRVLGLKPQGSTIQSTGDLFTNIEYEAYNILIDSYQEQETLSLINFDSLHSLRNAIGYSLKVNGERFKYKLNPKIVADMIAVMKPGFDSMFSLPSQWQFSRYSLGDFRKVFGAVCAIAHIHWTARCMAVFQGCHDMGYVDSIYMRPFGDLLRQVVRYSGVPESEVRSILDDLSYGNRDILQPNPALQPLIKLNSEVYAIVPHLWICSSAERNLTALLNKLPSEKEIYAKLVNEKEELMRGCFTTGLCDKGFRFIWGKIRGFPDLDLAIIRDSEKACLLLELKWFIAPTTARERIEKSKEIEKGISQVLQLKQAFVNNHKQLLEKLNIDSSYRLEGIVVSDNWIGYANVQSPEIPVIRSEHLMAKLRATESLESVMKWLKNREYLPKEGKHFEVDKTLITIGDWTLQSPEIVLLIDDAFFPL